MYDASVTQNSPLTSIIPLYIQTNSHLQFCGMASFVFPIYHPQKLDVQHRTYTRDYF